MLVARQRELAALAERLAAKRAVILVGEAGIGKTTLLRAAAEATALPVYEGGGLASLSWRSYFALARAVGAEPPAGDAAFVADWVVTRAGEGVLVLDDLHWADRDTLALLPLLAGRGALLGAVRREDRDAALALRTVEAAGIEVLPVDPLAPPDADALLRTRHPGLGEQARAAVVESARGNALLLDQLAVSGERGLALGLEARVRRCTDGARTALALLGLLGRPAEARLLGEGLAELRSLNLVDGNGSVEPRHALLAEAAVETLDGAERLRLHARLAARLAEPGEAARHHLAAGELDEARCKALLAAETAARAADRAQHLATAALASRGAEHDALRLRAARALLAEGDHELAVTVVEGLVDGAAEARAEAHLVRARRELAHGDTQAFRRELVRGLRLVRGSRSPVEARLELERAHEAPALTSAERAVRLARRAHRLAHEARVDEARADAYLGEALSALGSADCLEHLERALEGARAGGDSELEFETALDLVGALDSLGRGDESRRLADELRERAAERHSRRWAAQFQWAATRFRLYLDGRLDEAIEELTPYRDDRSLGIELDQLRADLALALADRGRDRDSTALLESALSEARTQWGRDVLTLSRIEADWLAGRLEAVLASPPLHEALEPLAALARARTAFELERAHPDVRDLREEPLAAAVDAELVGLAAARRGSRAAASLLARAAELWAGQFVRVELACLWEAGEAARRAGDAARARDLLLGLERRCERLGFEPLARRARRSLRLLGHRVAPGVAASNGPLTEREREVLTLVSSGLSTRAIAARLCLSVHTVDSHVRAAREKLGARTRAEAAARAEELVRAAGADRL